MALSLSTRTLMKIVSVNLSLLGITVIIEAVTMGPNAIWAGPFAQIVFAVTGFALVVTGVFSWRSISNSR